MALIPSSSVLEDKRDPVQNQYHSSYIAPAALGCWLHFLRLPLAAEMELLPVIGSTLHRC